jgi:hypothetical protein
MSGKKVVTANSSVQCGKKPGHEGTVKLTVKGQALLTVSGGGVLVETDFVGAPIEGCQNQTVSSTNVACSVVTDVSGSALSHCLTVGGVPVVIDAPLAGVTVGSPAGTLNVVDVKQSVLIAE